MSEAPEQADVVVVGGGPAGLSAATELRRLGAGRVVVIEREAEPGGIPRHCGHPPFGMREFGRVLTGPAYAARLVRRAEAAGVEIRRRTTVTTLGAGGHLTTTSPDGLATIAGRAVLLATGVRETSRAARLIGGEKPGGVLPTGALQGLIYLEGRMPFRRPVILGSELVAFSALLTCRHAGIRPAAMIEAGPRPTAMSASVLLARAMGVPFLANTTVEAIHGRERVEAVTIRDGSGQRDIATDGVIVSGQFRPEATLLRQGDSAIDPASLGPEIDVHGRLSDPVYFATGNLLRPVETAGWCWAEGRRTARSIMAGLEGRLAGRTSGLRLALEGDALKLAVPQVLLPGAQGPAAMDRLQIRLNRPAKGRLTLLADDRAVTGRRVHGLPERRILLTLPTLPEGVRALRLSFVED